MKKLHISIIGLAAIALLAISASCICASENADVLTVGDVGFTITDRVISVDNETGKILVEFNYELNFRQLLRSWGFSIF